MKRNFGRKKAGAEVNNEGEEKDNGSGGKVSEATPVTKEALLGGIMQSVSHYEPLPEGAGEEEEEEQTSGSRRGKGKKEKLTGSGSKKRSGSILRGGSSGTSIASSSSSSSSSPAAEPAKGSTIKRDNGAA
jgi:hypothetical protein